MDHVVYSQYYRTRTPERQLEIDECLRRNLKHTAISRMVLFCESDAPPVPQGTVPVEVVASHEPITYAEWFRWVKRQGSGIGLLLNADIYLDEGLEHLTASCNGPDTFLALTRYNPGHAGFHLNDYPHWTQDVWGVRSDAELPERLLYASSFPLGFPGCDNRIAYVMWSHGFRVRNPCYHVRSVHLHASTARTYDKTSDRLYDGVSCVHSSLAPDEDAELEFTLWTRSGQRAAGVLINPQAIEQRVHQLRNERGEAGFSLHFQMPMLRLPIQANPQQQAGVTSSRQSQSSLEISHSFMVGQAPLFCHIVDSAIMQVDSQHQLEGCRPKAERKGLNMRSPPPARMLNVFHARAQDKPAPRHKHMLGRGQTIESIHPGAKRA